MGSLTRNFRDVPCAPKSTVLCLLCQSSRQVSCFDNALSFHHKCPEVTMDYTLATIDRESQDPVAFAEWLADEGFIESGDQACHRCGRGMGFGESKHYRRDEVVVRCHNQRCRAYHSIRSGSFFQPSPLSLKQQMQLLTLFTADATVSSAARALGIGRKRSRTFLTTVGVFGVIS